MSRYSLAFSADAQSDLIDIWQLIGTHDGSERADRVLARIEAFCRSLEEFAQIGTRHEDRRNGLRSVGIPGLARVSILFIVGHDRVTVLRIGYLGRQIWSGTTSP